MRSRFRSPSPPSTCTRTTSSHLLRPLPQDEVAFRNAGGTPTEAFVENMGTMVERIRKAGARPAR
jgi:hypothetical protein